MPNVPPSNTSGLVLLSRGDGQNSSYWGTAASGSGTTLARYVWSGPIGVPYGYFLHTPPFNQPAPTNLVLTQVIAYCGTGTCTIDILQAPAISWTFAGIGGLTGLTINTFSTLAAATYTPTAVTAVDDMDGFMYTVTAVGAHYPRDLTVQFQVDPA